VNNKILIRISLVTSLILVVPFVVMQFTDEVNWKLIDFVVAGVLLFGAGFLFEFIAGNRDEVKYRVLVGLVIALVIFLVWAEFAVGIFGTPWAGS
jgi:hypothetical protein